MFGQGGHRTAGPCCLTQHLQDRLAGGAVDPDVRGAFQGLGIRAAGAFDHSHVILEGVSVGVDLDVLNFGAVLAQVLVERDETRLVRLNEVDPSRHALPLVFEAAFSDLVGRDEDEWTGHVIRPQCRRVGRRVWPSASSTAHWDARGPHCGTPASNRPRRGSAWPAGWTLSQGPSSTAWPWGRDR